MIRMMIRAIAVAAVGLALGAALSANGADAQQSGCKTLGFTVTTKQVAPNPTTGALGFQWWEKVERVRCGSKTVTLTTHGANPPVQ